MNSNLKALLSYRLEQAEESLASAKLLLDNDKYRPSVSRAYYAMFYAVLALIAQKKLKASKHSGAIPLLIIHSAITPALQEKHPDPSIKCNLSTLFRTARKKKLKKLDKIS